MGWKGALAGGAFGAVIGGPLGAVIGAAVGHLATGSGGNENSSSGSDRMQAVFVVAIFSTLAKLAKADGVVSADEAQMIKRFINDHFKQEDRAFIKQVFNAARDNGDSFESYFDQLCSIVGDDREFKQHFLGVLCELALADGVLHPAEKAQLLYAERVFGLNGYVDTFFQYGNGAAQGGAQNLNVYYEILGCTEAATDDEIKSAYRKKCRDFHPDRIQSKGLPEEFISFAEKEMQRINQAYDEIKKARKIS
ncbi:MAG: TerB family tellurite resistance protein [Lentisphaeria bacterium]|nr:TerB family tellurite resistance protein [Lentisphaeria bacterium]